MRFIRFIVFVLVCICLIWLVIFLLTRSLSRSKTEAPTSPKTDIIQYANTGVVAEMAMDGPIIADDDHEAVRITVGRDQTHIRAVKGYNGQVVRERSFPNTAQSYQVFLKSLDGAGFTQGKSSAENSEEGKCPQGNRYVYSLKDGSSDILRYWSSSCTAGTYGGNVTQTQWLFRNQIPVKDYYEVLEDYDLQ